jgi:uncharacterized membrane protein
VAISWGNIPARLPGTDHRTPPQQPGRSAGRLLLITLALLIIIAALGLTLLSLIELKGWMLRLASVLVPVLIVAAATFLSVGDRLDRN